MAREIPLTRGKVAIVDDEDFEWLSQWKWCAGCAGKYALRGHERRALYMHRFILGASAGTLVDHVNGNGLDNRRCNLRLCTTRENSRNQRGRALYKGVYRDFRRADGVWRARIKLPDKTLHIGAFDTPEAAARAYDAAAIKHFGDFARLNFADSGALPPPVRAPKQARGERINTARLTEDQVREIRALYDAGVPVRQLADRFGMSQHPIRQITLRRSWRHVPEAA